MDNNSNNNRTSATANSSSNTNASTTTAITATTTNASGSSAASSTATSSSIRQSHKRTFSESDSSSRTERHLCSFSHLWIINYLSSYIDDSNSTCLQSESFSPVNTPYSNTRWSLKLYPRGLNEKQHANNNIAIFLKYVSGTMPTIKAKAEFSVVSRNNELVMLRSTNFHTFSSGNDWGYSEFLDGNYLNSRRNDLITDDRLRVYVRVVLVDEKETTTGDLIRHAHHHHHHHPSSILPPPPPPPLPSSQHPNQQQQTSTTPKIQASTSSSSASSSTATSMNNSNPSSTSTTSSTMISGLFSDDKERFKSLEFLSNQIKTLLDDERFADVHIHVISKQSISIQPQPQQQTIIIDDHKKPNRTKHPRLSSKQQQQQQHHPSCSSCHCTSEKIKSSSTTNEQISDHHEQSSSVLCKDSESDIFDCRHSTNVSSQNYTSSSSSSVTPTIRRTTRSTSSLLSRIAQSSTSSSSVESNCSTSFIEPSSSDICSSSSLLSLSSTTKRCSCICHCQDNTEQDIHLEIQQSQLKYANVTPLATFHAHKAVLMSRSSSFATQIRHSTNYNKIDSKLPSIDLYIDDLDPLTVRIMLIYIYTGRLVTSNDDMKTNINAIDLFRAAVKYDLHELRQLAKSTMLDALKVDNAIEMLEVSDQANDVSLKQQVLAFIRSNASAVSKTNNWLQFTKRYPHLVIDAFRSLVTPPSTTNTKLNNNTTTTTTTTANNNNNNNTFHSTSLTTTSILWKKFIERKVLSDSLWDGLAKRRGWTKYLFRQILTSGETSKSHEFYRTLYPKILNDIKQIETNWHTGKFQLEKIQCRSQNSKGVYCLQYDDEKIVSGLRDNTIKIWDRKTSQCTKVLTGHNGSVLCLQYDEKVIVTGSSDSTVRIWNVKTGELINTLLHHCEAVLHLRFWNGTMVTCSKDRSIAVWQMNSPTDITIRRVLVGHRAAVNVVDFDEKYIVSASGDRTIKVWDTTTCEFVRTLLGHKRGIACLQYRDKIVVSGSSDNTIRIWDIECGACLRILEGHDELVRCIRFDTKRIVSGAYDGILCDRKGLVLLLRSSCIYPNKQQQQQQPLNNTLNKIE
ncbi:unnamed protein product [Rotaria socialis]|uniref:Uncharacterized protein n=2 Tax=Rotaria TaxID=231623 RepID=A0A820C0H4_9BILA|nr:unnamed protein product [Rotaria socialis]